MDEHNIFKNPHRTKQRIDLPGRFNSLIVRKMRQGVFKILAETGGSEYADTHWQYQCEMIIKAHMVITDPANYSRALTADQVEKIKERFSNQLEFLQSINKSINEWKSEEQMISFHGLL